MSRTLLRAGTVAATAALLALAGATPALAHVTAQGTVTKGGYGVVTFRVPNEDATAGTVALTVTLPADHPFRSVRTTPMPGWTATTSAGSVTWKANPGTRVGPGQYLDFPVSLGPFPADVDTLSFPAAQAYDNGKVVTWADPARPDGPEPEHPVPTVTLTAASAEGHTSGAALAEDGTDGTARWLGGAGLLVGALGLGVGGGAVLRNRKKVS
jgi:periplasmic copper chaperone A